MNTGCRLTIVEQYQFIALRFWRCNKSTVNEATYRLDVSAR